MQTRFVTIALGLVVVGGTAAAGQGKPAPQPAVVNWRCDVQMRDADGDAIKSDGVSTYADGTGGFICSMSPMSSSAAGNPAPGSATLYFGRGATRSLFFPARSGPDGTWSAGSDTSIQIRVFSLADMPIGTEARAMAIPTSRIGAMYADAGGAASDLVTVVRVDSCTWEVSFDQDLARVERFSSLDRKRLLGTPQLPLGFTLVTRAPSGASIPPCPTAP